MPDDRLHVGVACPLPPAPTGPATYLAGMLPRLEEHAAVTCFVADPFEVDSGVRSRWEVLPLDARHRAECDVVVYHLANNPLHRETLRAALEGPPGLIVLHDASLHHLLVDELVGYHRFEEYGAWLKEAHAARGGVIAEARLYGGTEIEQFVFDALAPVLDRHLAVQVHSRWAAAMVEDRCPGLPVFLVPHYASRSTTARASWRAGTTETVKIGHFGFVTRPKRYAMLCEAVGALVDGGTPVELVFVGADHTHGDLERTIARLGLEDVVSVTGWVDDARLAEWIAAVDMAVSLRWPQVGESSGTLASLLAAGVPVVVEAVGSWAEVPSQAVVRMAGLGTDALLAALGELASSPARRRAVGDAAAEYSRQQLDVAACAAAFVDAVKTVAAGDRRPPRAVVSDRRAAVGAYVSTAVDSASAATAALLEDVPPARPGACLVAVGCAPATASALASSWGYTVIHAQEPEGTRLPVASGAVDVVLCGEPVAPPLLRDVNRVLVPGGAAYLVGEAGLHLRRLADPDGLLDAAGLSRAATTRSAKSVIVQKCGVPLAQPYTSSPSPWP